MLKKYYYMKELRLKLNDYVQANLGSNFSKNECKGAYFYILLFFFFN